MKKALQGIAVLIALGLLAFGYSQWRERVEPPVEFLPANPGAASLPAAPAAPAPPRPTPPPNISPAFTSFLAAEAPSLDDTHVDAAAAEARIMEQVARMQEPEIKYARDLVLSDSAPANEQILASYMLSRAGPKARQAQGDLVLRDFPPPGEPHSMDEQKNMAAKANALTQIEALAKEARTSREARDTLMDWGRREKDPELLKHITDAIRSLPPL